MKNVFLIGLLCGLGTATFAGSDSGTNGVPKIDFAQTTFDFGKTSQVASVSGTFKFKNSGTGTLHVDKPKPSCGCTDPEVIPDTLAPGQSGEVKFTVKLDRASGKTEKYITVHSNDPKTPDVKLTVDLDYTPLYQMSSMTLPVMLPAGVNETNTSFTITRTDGKPAQIEAFRTSQDWISAALDESAKPEDKTVKVNVTVRRPPGPPQFINAIVSMFGGGQGTNEKAKPLQGMFLAGQVMGDITASPAKVFWALNNPAKLRAERPPEMMTQTVELTPGLDKPFELKNAACDLKGISVKIVTKEPGKRYQLVLTMDEVPDTNLSGNVTVETSLASLPKMDVPVNIRIYQN